MLNTALQLQQLLNVNPNNMWKPQTKVLLPLWKHQKVKQNWLCRVPQMPSLVELCGAKFVRECLGQSRSSTTTTVKTMVSLTVICVTRSLKPGLPWTSINTLTRNYNSCVKIVAKVSRSRAGLINIVLCTKMA